jgi:hypothetical protein
MGLFLSSSPFGLMPVLCSEREPGEDQMALFDDIFSGGNWVTGLAIGVGAVVILPLAAPILRPLAKTAIKGGILAYQGAAGLFEGIGDLVAEAAAETGGEISPPASQRVVHTSGRAQPRHSGD